MPDIIIVEDNKEIGTLLCDFLRKENYTVSLADTGEKALSIFEQYGAKLLVLDIGLPGLDGFSVCSRINGIFKRKYAREEIICNNLKLNTVTQTLTVEGKAVSVTEKEFQLLRLLVENKGITLKKDYLFNSVWGSDSESEPQTLTVHIKWLREKTEKDPKKPEHIITVWGTGYRYE